MADYCSPCEDLKTNAADFMENGVTDTVCQSIMNNTGLNGASTNCADFGDMVDCLIGQLSKESAAYDICDWKAFTSKLMANLYNVFGALVCDLCGQWKYIDALIDAEGYITVVKTYSHTVPAESFTDIGHPSNIMYWADTNDSFLSIPVPEMDIVDTVVAQPQVVGGAVHAATVAVQTAVQEGDNYIVDFDAYEIEGSKTAGFPYSLPINFVVVGRKKITV